MGRKRRSPRVKKDGSESDEDFTRFFVCISLTSADNVVTCRYYRSEWVLTFFVRKMSLEDIVVCTNLRPLSDSPFWLIDRVADHTGGILRHYRTESFLVGFELVSTSFGNLKAYFGHNGHEFILRRVGIGYNCE